MIDPTKAELDQLLAQAEGFARGGDYPGAVTRAEWACEQIRRRVEERSHADPDLEELLRAAELRLAEYKKLAKHWHAQVSRRHAAYVSRELGSIQPTSDAIFPTMRR
jgi:hypothetical protein